MAEALTIDKLAGAFKHIPTPVQLVKIVEEVGEAGEAYIGIEGWNPRKGATHTIEDFHKELLDIALTALMLYRNTGGGPPLARLSLHVDERWERHEREVGSFIPRDARGTRVKVGCYVTMNGAVAEAMEARGEVVGTRSGLGNPEPEALVLWGDRETWTEARKLVVWLTEQPGK
jgi:hypothetical protein